MIRAEISSIHFAVPERMQSAADVCERIEFDAEWVEQTVGVANRYVSCPGDDPAVLAAAAARPVIEARGVPDLVVFASATVRQFLPDTSVFVARELGIEDAACFSVHATCLSSLIALHHASLCIAAGQYKRILVVSAELSSQSRDWNHPESAALLGDGAAALMVEATERDAGLVHFLQHTWPEHAELAQIKGGGLLRHPQSNEVKAEDYLFRMDGEQLLRATLPLLRKFLKEFFSDSSVSPGDLDWIIPHQTSGAGMKLIKRLGLPEEKTVNILRQYGNCVSSSIPMALATAQQDGKLKRGDHILLLGSAAGLSLGAILWKW